LSNLVATAREFFERQDGPFDFVPALADRLVEAGGPSALAAAAFAVGLLVLRLGDGALDLPSAQATAVAAGGVRLIGMWVGRLGRSAGPRTVSNSGATLASCPNNVPIRYQPANGERVDDEGRRPDSADIGMAGCGWLLIVAVIAMPGLILNDGPLTVYLVVVGGVIGFLWARKRLLR
jgi:hypothetical protein